MSYTIDVKHRGYNLGFTQEHMTLCTAGMTNECPSSIYRQLKSGNRGPGTNRVIIGIVKRERAIIGTL